MKFFRITALLLIAFALYQSCTSSFNPAAPYKNITIVYGLLSIRDTVHYIKIEKAFLSENGGNAYTEAAVADSLYYPVETVNASLEAINNGNIVSTLPLTRADGATLGVNKDTGIFATNPNIVYYTKSQLNPAYTYELVINNTKTGQTNTSQTSIVDSFLITNPNTSIPIDFNPQQYFDASWQPTPNAELYQLVIFFYYREINIANPADSTLNYATWTFPTQVYPYTSGSNSYVYQIIPGANFYDFAASFIPVNPLVKRRALSFDFWFYAGGPQLYTYQLVSVANSTSLVEGIINPTYTNINNGYGLFSSTYLEEENGLGVAAVTRDSLAHSKITKQLQFMDQYGQTFNQ
jgi:hypothetical protein